MGSQSFEGLSSTGKTLDGRKVAVSLNHVSTLAGWATPKAQDEKMARRSTEAAHRFMERPLKSSELGIEVHQTIHPYPARRTASGEILTGSSAGMESGGQLSPAHSLWLMLGPFATAWAFCGEQVMRSTSRKRKGSSKP